MSVRTSTAARRRPTTSIPLARLRRVTVGISSSQGDTLGIRDELWRDSVEALLSRAQACRSRFTCSRNAGRFAFTRGGHQILAPSTLARCGDRDMMIFRRTAAAVFIQNA